jgi:hypothetical protein
MSTLHLGTWTAVVVAALGCGGSQPVHDASPESFSVPDSIDVEVINQNYYDANIYAIYGEAERRWVGNVPGVGTRSSFVLPWYPRTLAFEIDFVVGPGVFISDRVDVARGDAVQLTVPPNILASGFFRRLRR